MVYRDAGGPDPAKSRQLAEELILREKMQFLAGFAFTPNALAVAQLVTEAKMPTVIFNAATAVDHPPLALFRARQLHAAAGHRAARRVGAQERHQEGRHAGVRLRARPRRRETLPARLSRPRAARSSEAIRIPLATTDFAPFFERILQQKPDAMFMFGPGGPASVVDDQHLGDRA